MPSNSPFDSANVMSVSVEGLADAQRLLSAAEHAADPRGGLRNSLTLATGMVHRYVISLGQDHPPLGMVGVLPVQTGRLKNSLFWLVESKDGGLVGRVTSNVAYAPSVEARRGFMGRTVRDMRGPVQELLAADIDAKITRESSK